MNYIEYKETLKNLEDIGDFTGSKETREFEIEIASQAGDLLHDLYRHFEKVEYTIEKAVKDNCVLQVKLSVTNDKGEFVSTFSMYTDLARYNTATWLALSCLEILYKNVEGYDANLFTFKNND